MVRQDDLAVAERKAAAASSGGGKLVEGERRSLMEALLSTLPNNSKHLGLPCYPDGLAPAPNGTKVCPRCPRSSAPPPRLATLPD